MKKNIYLIITFSSLFFLITLILSFIINYNFKFNINGQKNIELEVNTSYKEEGFNAILFKKNINNKIKIKSNLNNKKIGEYEISYYYRLMGIKHKIIRKIKVVDKEKPSIKLNGEESIYLYKDDDYRELGAISTDNYDKDLTNEIIITNNINNKKLGEYYVVYSVKDSSNNKTTIKRKVIVTNNKVKINNPILDYIVNNNYNISFGYYNLKTGKSYLYNEDKIYFAASLIKTVEALYLYDNNLINDELKPYVKKAITISDNPAHHYIQNYIGKNNLKKYGESLGAKHTLEGGGVCGNTSVNDQMIFLKRLYEITNNNNEELKAWFMNDYVNSIKFNDNIPVMHKYGLYSYVYHDVGIVLDEEPYIIIILTGKPNEYKKVVNNLSKIVYDYHKNI